MSTLSKAYQDAISEMENKVDEACKEAFHDRVYVIYSAYSFDQYDTPINNLSEVVIKGKVKFVDEGDDFSKEESNYEPFESLVYDSPTWLELAVIANSMINKTCDHVYLEDIHVVDVKDGIQIAKIIMGS